MLRVACVSIECQFRVLVNFDSDAPSRGSLSAAPKFKESGLSGATAWPEATRVRAMTPRRQRSAVSAESAYSVRPSQPHLSYVYHTFGGNVPRRLSHVIECPRNRSTGRGMVKAALSADGTDSAIGRGGAPCSRRCTLAPPQLGGASPAPTLHSCVGRLAPGAVRR